MSSMTDVYMWFAGLVTPGGIAYLITGYLLAVLTHCIRQRRKHKPVVIPWHLVGISIGVIFIIVTSLQSSSAYNLAKQTAQDVQDCQKQFNAALRDRARITSENDELSQTQRKIIYTWIHDLIFPPPPYNGMAGDDPVRQQWALARTIDTDRQFGLLQDQQNTLQRQRDSHPLPDPTCGK